VVEALEDVVLMGFNRWRSGGLSLALLLAVGCGGGSTGDLPRAPASTADSSAPAAEKQVGKVKSMVPADAAEKYK